MHPLLPLFAMLAFCFESSLVAVDGVSKTAFSSSVAELAALITERVFVLFL